MARRTAELVTGAAIIVVAGGFLGYAVAHSGRGTTAGYPLHASFDHIDGLNVGADVRIAGVKVGSVTGESIDPQTYQAKVTFTVQDGLGIPADSSAEITSDGLLGGKFLSLSAGGSTAMFKPGQTVTITQGSISLEQLLGKFIFSASNLASARKPGDDTGGAPPKPQ